MSTLTEIGTKHKTDKASWHKFTDLYDDYFKHLRHQPIKILEIGVFQGASLRMWEEYFTEGMVYGVDDCSLEGGGIVTPASLKAIETNRIKTFEGSGRVREDLKRIIEQIGEPEIIVDDGHHFQDTQQISLGFLFPYVKSKGIYVIEDLCLPDRTKEGWGLKDLENHTDNTTKILGDFKKTGKMVSPYMTEFEMRYLNENIDSVSVYQVGSEENIIAFIKKK